MRGKSIKQLSQLSYHDIISTFDIPEVKIKSAILIEDLLKKITNETVKTYKSNKKPALEVSAEAKVHLIKQLAKHQGCVGIRLSVKEAGCSGLKYDMSYETQPTENDKIFPMSDHFSIYIDPKSYLYYKGTKILFKKEGLNEKIVFDNPNATQQCGCGESFVAKN